ncbi:MAG: bifunctional methylenetetrahydrofolate dehydrogenase/methenyltetrahydrofolate cyclohydrolase FolD [Myxococcota bacterium]
MTDWIEKKIDGKALAKSVRSEVRVRAEEFRCRFGRPIGLDVVLVGSDPASQVYVRNKERAATKAGIQGCVHRLPASTTQDDVEDRVRKLSAKEEVDGILVQLPLPDGLDETSIVDLIDPRKDVDGLHPQNLGLLVAGREGLQPCTPRGCMRLLQERRTALVGARAIVVGRSALVGKPLAAMLVQQHATVTVAHSRTEHLQDRVLESDVVVAAVGKPGLVHGSWIKPGAVVIDVGINRLGDGSLVGDVDYTSALERASAITPVPGGVGPMTIAMLLDNVVRAAFARKT